MDSPCNGTSDIIQKESDESSEEPSPAKKPKLVEEPIQPIPPPPICFGGGIVRAGNSVPGESLHPNKSTRLFMAVSNYSRSPLNPVSYVPNPLAWLMKLFNSIAEEFVLDHCYVTNALAICDTWSYCACRESIRECCVMRNIHTGKKIVIGGACIKHFNHAVKQSIVSKLHTLTDLSRHKIINNEEFVYKTYKHKILPKEYAECYMKLICAKKENAKVADKHTAAIKRICSNFICLCWNEKVVSCACDFSCGVKLNYEDAIWPRYMYICKEKKCAFEQFVEPPYPITPKEMKLFSEFETLVFNDNTIKDYLGKYEAERKNLPDCD